MGPHVRVTIISFLSFLPSSSLSFPVLSTYGPATGEARWERAAGNGRCGGAATREKGRRSGGRDVKTVLGEMTRATGGALRGSPALGDDDGLGTSQRGAR